MREPTDLNQPCFTRSYGGQHHAIRYGCRNNLVSFVRHTFPRFPHTFRPMGSASTPTMLRFLPTPFGYDDDSRILQSSSATRYKKTLKIIERANLTGVWPHPSP